MAGLSKTTQRIKRICVLSDGTWNDPELECLTNIVKIGRAIEYEDDGGIQQVVYYDPGVGLEGNRFERLKGGAMGDGIDKNIQELYTFLALNYHPGDEIYLFGYSRGAYTVRSLAGFIHEAGLVRRDATDFVKEAYDLYRSDVDCESATAREFRAAHGDRVPIKLLACFDTVGALGVPWDMPWPLSSMNNKYHFHNTKISRNIEHAIHILSIDEDRKAFRPTFMHHDEGRGPSQVTQLFFPGTHSGVGGSNPKEKMLGENTLCFLVKEMKDRGIPLMIDEKKIPSGGNYDVVPRDTADEGMFSSRNLMKFLAGSWSRQVRSLEDCHVLAIKRYQVVRNWRPPALEKFRDQLLKFDCATRGM